jgi:lipopolysaccharide/colanic/teichoic acid biosynthesis glycosyltransferase
MNTFQEKARLVGILPTLERIRYQLLGGLLFAVGIPVLLYSLALPSVIFSWNTQVTVAAACIAHLTGYFIYRRLGSFPGVAAVGEILPAFALSYGLIFLVIFFFRLDYSRFQAASSCILSITWYFMLSQRLQTAVRYRLAIVPGGNVDQLRSLDRVVWYTLPHPNVSVKNVHGVVVDLRGNLSEEWERFIADCAMCGMPVYHVKQIIESLTGRVSIEHLSENTFGTLTPNQTYENIKHVVEWLMALVAVVLLSPLLIAVAIAIRLDSPGPALFRQERVGYRRKTFTVYKFRTMRSDAASEPGDERERAITLKKDARITRLGKFLRQKRIDELPQLFNILRGEMSWIGPRPEALVLSQWYEKELPYYPARHHRLGTGQSRSRRGGRRCPRETLL